MRDKALRDAALRGFGLLGGHAVKRTRSTDVDSLIRSLRPIDAGPELIRVGPDGDGGYLVPDDLDGIRHAFSPGVALESGFELELAAKGMHIYLADHSVDAPAAESPAFTFEKKFVGATSNETFMTLDEWKQGQLGDYEGDLLLQMDIEGGEFEALMAMSSRLQSQFRIMVIEFHYLHQLWNKPWFILVQRVFSKLLETHSVVHIHPNNCCGAIERFGLAIPRVAEFSFLRNDRVRRREPCRTFPHPLDSDNTAKKTLVLPSCWYR